MREGSTDLAIANISITADREEVMDFSNSIFRSGLQIMVPKNNNSVSILHNLKDPIILSILLVTVVALAICANILYFAERSQSKKISTKYLKGCIEAIWWTLTLGGFGRNLPQTLWGRTSLLGWMGFLTLSVIALTSQLTTNLTSQNLGSVIKSLEDLQGKKVGTTAGSTSETYLRTRNIDAIPYSSIGELFADVSNGKIDAVMHDAPLLQYYASTAGRETVLLSGSIFNEEDYGIALPTGSPLREEINETMLRLRENGTYKKIHDKWFTTN